jgi:hypothetical protein
MEEHLQRLLLAGTLGLAMARKAAAILEGEQTPGITHATATPQDPRATPQDPTGTPQNDQAHEGAVLRAILDAANECLGHFDDRPPSERWCDALLHLLDLAAFAAELG